jgi:cardiolipin synthase
VFTPEVARKVGLVDRVLTSDEVEGAIRKDVGGSVRIVTPYFLPDQALVSALNIAALRGVTVDIVLPEAPDVRLVRWAAAAQLWQVLGSGCRVWSTPPPFDHAKLLVVDDGWALIGSANLDPRSLRLSFELQVECFDGALACELARLVDGRMEKARRVTLEQMDARRMPARLRDGAARLLSPFL